MNDRLSPKNLRVFLSVYEEGSGARGAERLLRAPSAISRTIREIESELATPLFDRTSSGMGRTPAAELLYQRAKAVRNEFIGAQRELLEHGAQGNSQLFSMMVTGRQIDAILKLDELGHMPSVAQALGVTQPAISSVIRQVEQSLKVRLFERLPRRMCVTAPGEVLVFRLRRVRSEIRRLRADVSQLSGAVAGTVMISALPSSKTSLMPKAIANVIARHPDVRVYVVDAPYEVLFAGLRSGEIDFIFTGIGPEYMRQELNVHPVATDRLVVVARSGHPLAASARRPIRVRDLARFPWVLRDPGAPSRQLLNNAFHRVGLSSPKIAVESGDLGLLRGLLTQSDMLTAVSPYYVQRELQAGTLAILDFDLPGCERDIGFVLRKDVQPSAVCLLLMNEIRDILSAHGSMSSVGLWAGEDAGG